MSHEARDASGHRWSGWPGAYCMYCFAEDVRELCLADGHDLDCKSCVQVSCQLSEAIRDEMDRFFNPPDVGDRLVPPPKP